MLRCSRIKLQVCCSCSLKPIELHFAFAHCLFFSLCRSPFAIEAAAAAGSWQSFVICNLFGQQQQQQSWPISASLLANLLFLHAFRFYFDKPFGCTHFVGRLGDSF